MRYTVTGGIGIVGARALPADFKGKVQEVVAYLVGKGYFIHSGGALGADQYALEALVALGAEARAVVFSAWSSIKGFPRNIQQYVEFLASYNGKIVEGDVDPGSPRHTVIAGLLARNQRLVDASSGLVAFLYGESRGTMFTISRAVKRKLSVVIFPIDIELPQYDTVRWVPLRAGGCWAGGYKAEYIEKHAEVYA